MNNEWDIVNIQKVTFFMAHPLLLILMFWDESSIDMGVLKIERL